MSNKKKGEISVAGIISLTVSAFVTGYAKYPFNIAEFFSIENDFITNAIPIIAGIASGFITYFVLSKWIKIDEI